MMITVYIFVAAAFLSVISMLIIFNVNIAKLKKDSGQISKVQKQFFIGAALSKIAPTLLLILGILNMPSNIVIDDLYVPWLLILIIVIYGFYHVSRKKKVNTNHTIDTLVTLTRPHLVLSLIHI